MIHITDIDGRSHFLSVSAVAIVSEPGNGAQWHGVKAHVKTFDGQTIEAREEADWIRKMIEGGSR